MKKVDEIGLLEAFDSLARAGSLFGAADELRISRSTLLRRIMTLEKRLGIDLFVRDERGSRLSIGGQKFLIRAQKTLSLYREATAPISKKSEQDPVVHVSCAYSLGTTLLIPWISTYRKLHPEFRVDLDLTIGPRKLLDPMCDIRISHGRAPSERVLSKPLGLMPRLMAASPDYLDHAGMPSDPSQLVQHCLLGGQDLAVRSHCVLRCGEEFVRVPFHPHVRLKDHTAAKAATLAGIGIGLHLLRHEALEDINQGRLVEVLEQWIPEPCPISLMMPLSHPIRQEVKDFADFIENCWKRHPVLLPPNSEQWR